MNQVGSRSVTRLQMICASIAFTLLLVGGKGFAQEPGGVGISVEFPSIGSLLISAEEVTFDLSGQNYPPAEFPATYLPVEPSEPITITVTSNTSSWRLSAEFTGLVNVEENLQLPASQLEYSIDGSVWLPFSTQPVYLTLDPPLPTDVIAAPRVHTLELRLVVIGNEAPGKYEGTLTFSLTTQ